MNALEEVAAAIFYQLSLQQYHQLILIGVINVPRIAAYHQICQMYTSEADHTPRRKFPKNRLRAQRPPDAEDTLSARYPDSSLQPAPQV